MILPMVSIITPSYNQGRFIKKTIDSVLSQDYPNIEYIIVDGGSTDETFDIVNMYKGKLHFISEKDNGQSDAINKGFKMAKGEIVAWLNSDDLYEPGCVTKVVGAFASNPNLGFIYGDGYIIDENDKKLKVFEATQEFDLWTLVNVWDYIMQPTTFFKKKELEKVGYLNEHLQWCMDWDLWIRLALNSEVLYIREFLACSREYEETKTSTGGKKRLKEIKTIMQKYSCQEEPLGYKMYTLNTKATRWKKIKSLRYRYQGELIETQQTIFDNLPKRYADGWIGKKYSMILGKNVSKISFIIDNILYSNLPQKITVVVNDIETENILLEEIVHDYRLDLDLVPFAGVKYVDIICEKCCIASSQDKRLLGINIKKIICLAGEK